MFLIANKTFKCVITTYSEHFSEVLKTITTDNDSEFADLSELMKIADTLVYFAHTHSSCSKGTVAQHNGLIRRFIPKGKRTDNFTGQLIYDVKALCN